MIKDKYYLFIMKILTKLFMKFYTLINHMWSNKDNLNYILNKFQNKNLLLKNVSNKLLNLLRIEKLKVKINLK